MLWILIIFLLLIFTFIFLVFVYMKANNHKLYGLYLALVSLVSIIAITITLWIVLTSLGKSLIISDEEYIQNSRNWEIRECDEPKFITGRDERLERTHEEIKKCKKNARDSAIKARSFNLKDMFITSGAWFIVFVIVFLFHYPKFLKTRETK